MLKRSAFTAIVLAILWCPVWAQTPGSTGVIEGKILGGDHHPLEGIRVRAAGLVAGQQVMSGISTTDETGAYRITGVPAGEWAVIAGELNTPTYYPGVNTATDGALVRVSWDKPATGIDFALAPAADTDSGMPTLHGTHDCSSTLEVRCENLRGAVVYPANRPAELGARAKLSGKITDRSGRPVSGAQVTAASRQGFSEVLFMNSTDAQGEYSFASLPPGNYSIRTMIEGRSLIITRELSAGGNTADIHDNTR
ncbi:MAG TPA: carboxypeptidase-like regulatory domain-containing protein [Terriglobia bacterium]|nr:carboxypeptidase-like regulatory domain-containing protein [Terriglobia bacterium]